MAANVPSELQLDSEVTDEDAAVIAQCHLEEWEELSPFLGLKSTTNVVVKNNNSGDYAKQKMTFLREWKKQRGHEASFGALIEAATKAGNKLLADNLKDMLINRSKPTGGKFFGKGK